MHAQAQLQINRLSSAAHRSKTSLSKSHRHSQATCNSHVSPLPSFIRSENRTACQPGPSKSSVKTSGSVSVTEVARKSAGGIKCKMACKVKKIKRQMLHQVGHPPQNASDTNKLSGSLGTAPHVLNKKICFFFSNSPKIRRWPRHGKSR